MSKVHGHKHSGSVTQNQKAHLANAYNELGKELSSHKFRVVGNYTLGRVIGEGAYGKVRMGTHRLTSTRVAIKQIPKAMSASLTREIHHHRQLHHPHVTQMYEVIATESSIWIVTELCSGGELFDYLAEKGRLSEDETRFIFGQLCLAVAYLHDKGIVHRDLKLENVLLDERCRVKLGDFGFTREFERGVLMETFCGTTGYASPEMLQGKKYLGAEVDIWSLGVILYVLLTGMLPFDDDDESIMRDKVILAEFEDPDWLSSDARDLIKNILQKDPSKRLSIPQILTHSWFTFKSEPEPEIGSLSPPADTAVVSDSADSALSSEASTTDSSLLSGTSAPTTPDRSISDPFETDTKPMPTTLHSNPSETTIRKVTSTGDSKSSTIPTQHPETVAEEGQDEDTALPLDIPLNLQRQRSNSSGRSSAPPVHTVRTPARTKRRSVSSTLSDHDVELNPDHCPPSGIHINTDSTSGSNNASQLQSTPILPSPQSKDLSKSNFANFASLLTTPAPLIFSTPLERELLNALSLMGLDLGQIVYSVLNDACDAASAVWWMLKRKAEKRVLELGSESLLSALAADGITSPVSPEVEEHLGTHQRGGGATSSSTSASGSGGKRKRHNMGVQTTDHTTAGDVDATPQPHSHIHRPLNPLNLAQSAPQLAFVPATPTFPPPRSMTPPRASGGISMLTPSSSVVVDDARSLTSTSLASHSHPTTPSSSDNRPAVASEGKGSKGRKNRSGSVSINIMQRATTALEAAGLVRKKSSEAVKEEREREKEKERERERDREWEREKDSTFKEKGRERENERKMTGGSITSASGDELPPPPLSSHGSHHSSSWRAKSPSSAKGPSTPPPIDGLPLSQSHHNMGSPWVITDSRDSRESRESRESRDSRRSKESRRSRGSPTPHSRGAPTPVNSPGADMFTDMGSLHSHAQSPLEDPPNSSSSAKNASSTGKASASGRGLGLGSGSGASGSGSGSGPHRNRASLLQAFRLWFHEDRKGKRKENNASRSAGGTGAGPLRPSGSGYSTANVKLKRATSSGGGGSGSNGGGGTRIMGMGMGGGSRRGGQRTHRPSMSSRRSSSVNSRTSVGSVQMVLLDSPQVGRRSFGSHTPNSERGVAEYPNSSRPSSIRSFSTQQQQRHRKSPSASSTGSVSHTHYRATSPMQPRYHRRGGSGSSSTTRVVRQPGTPGSRPSHGRSNSAASSIHSPPSSRPTSFIEYNSDYEGGSGPVRTASPYRMRRSFEDTTPRRTTSTTFVAQKRQGPFASPMHGYGGSIGRSSWKKAWGLEPPGWQTRGVAAQGQFPVEVLAISPAEGASLRDVFSGPVGRVSLSLGDESDWVDEDDEVPYAGGLGQMTLSGSAGTGSATGSGTGEGNVLVGPAPRSAGSGKRNGKAGRKGHSPIRAPSATSDTYEAPEPRGGRRQLPAGRSSGPAFKQIMEEDEEEEEE